MISRSGMVRAAAGLRRRARPSGSRACSEYSQGALGTHDGGCSGYSRRVLRRAVGTTASSGAGPSPRQCSRSSSTKSAGLVGASHPIAEGHRIASHRIASHRIASHRIASHRIAAAARECGISCGGRCDVRAAGERRTPRLRRDSVEGSLRAFQCCRAQVPRRAAVQDAAQAPEVLGGRPQAARRGTSTPQHSAASTPPHRRSSWRTDHGTSPGADVGGFSLSVRSFTRRRRR
jgi:hypothetical protein